VAVTETDANYDAGMKADEAGNCLDAISAFKKSGSAKSYYMLGLIYENGCGNVGKNAMMARKNFKTAAQMGSEEAKAKL
jgi:TPR repeat protein